MKSYTDLEQSKKLAQILPIESADMCYIKREINDTFIETPILKPIGGVEKSLCCWSLAALINALPSATLDSSRDHYCKIHCMGRFTGWYENSVDACVTMIIKLHELNLL
jgi:hypothetical protein